MGIGFKHFIIDENDNLKMISNTRMNKLINQDQNTNLIEFAGKRIRYVTVAIEYENREPISVVRIQGHFLELDKDGKVDIYGFNKEMQTAIGMIEIPDITNESKNVINAESKFAQERYKHTYTWEIIPQIEERIYNAIFKYQ
jgi:UV DNA damage repair endonuclease